MVFSKKTNQIHLITGLLVLFMCVLFSPNIFAASTITGFVSDKQRNPLSDMDVELLNDYYQTIQRTRTDGNGRYQFSGLDNGRYSVKVYAFKYDMEDQTLPIEINTQNIRGGEGSGYFSLDFYLLPRKGGLVESEIGIVFAQDIPSDAKKLYEKGLDELSKKQTNQGIMTLNSAVKIFPDYFLALHRIGKELYILKKYSDAVPFFFKAAEINSKSASSFYYLGLSLNHISKDYNKSALASLKQAYTLAPSSMQILFGLGRVEREMGNFSEAEKHLLQAKKFSDGKVPDIHKELSQLYGNDLKKYKEAADELELYMKASKMPKEEEIKVKKLIADLREKSKTQGT